MLFSRQKFRPNFDDKSEAREGEMFIRFVLFWSVSTNCDDNKLTAILITISKQLKTSINTINLHHKKTQLNSLVKCGM